MKSPHAIFLMGPTASGKSNIALEIAKHLPVELISVDSAQVYRHMDIGTAKPNAATMASVPHHLINLIDPHERYSAGQFRTDALTAMNEITSRGRIPLLVGGTMLYFRTLFEGISELPSANNDIRKIIENRAESIGWPEMHKKLQKIDSVTATRIQPTDSQRIQRALEVYYLTNTPMSDLQKTKKVSFPYKINSIALIPDDRIILHKQIALRFEKMLKLGLIDEVRVLRETFDLNANATSMRCVGYRQACMYLDKKISWTEMHEMSIAATRQLAKRQLTWLRSMQKIKKFNCFSGNLPRLILDFLQENKLKNK
tara:strand:- start:48308 stop:49246 length:939 start_codon:yes stop_codon:yes gene_type:complete